MLKRNEEKFQVMTNDNLLDTLAKLVVPEYSPMDFDHADDLKAALRVIFNRLNSDVVANAPLVPVGRAMARLEKISPEIGTYGPGNSNHTTLIAAALRDGLEDRYYQDNPRPPPMWQSLKL